MLLMTAISGALMGKMQGLEGAKMRFSDQRVKLTNEVIQGTLRLAAYAPGRHHT